MPESSLDSLYSQVAKKVLKESLGVKKGQSVTVESWNNGLPFARHVVLEARRMGAIPMVVFEDEDAYVEGAKLIPKDVLGQMGDQEFALLSETDAYVFIPGPVLGSFSHRMDRAVFVDSVRYNDAWYKAAAKAKLKGVRLTFGYISDETKAVIGKSARSVVEHQLSAALADYKAIGKRAREIAPHFTEGAKVAIGTPRSKLALEVKGGVEIEDGVVDDQDLANDSSVTYIPPGYVYADVIPESVSGTFSFSPTVTRFGLISDGTLEFENGELVAAESEGSPSVLGKVVDGAKNKSATGLFVGLNPLLKYGYGQNANSAGVVSIRALGVSFNAKSAKMRAGTKAVPIKA